MFLILAFLPTVSYSQYDKFIEYSTKGNPKAMGHNFTIKIPDYYIKIKNYPSNYLEAFEIDDKYGELVGDGDIHDYFAIEILKVPNNITSSALQTNGNWDNNKLKKFWDIVAKDVPGIRKQQQTINWDNIPVLQLSTYIIEGEGSDNMAILFALHNNGIVKFECGTDTWLGNIRDIETTKEDLTESARCMAFFGSLKFLN
jgi:hypothetical protein